MAKAGHHYALYDEFADGRMRMRAGIAVSAPFADTDQVSCLQLPQLEAAHYRHEGSYSRLPVAHETLNQWCLARSLQREPLSFEVYGDWYEDESKLVTDVYIRVV